MSQQNGQALADLPRSRGSIIRIKLVDFMTFVNCEFFPGPRMNLILGPNGSGKSSLICAIGLGLGGTPKMLGRSSHTKDFIRKGQKQARIEIELFGGQGERNVIIERSLIESSSEWRVDGKKMSEEKVHERLRDMNIQVDNLVQFLPQDKVAEFSQFDEIQLLRETIRAALGPEYLEMQEVISDDQKKINSMSTRLEAKQRELDELLADIAREQSIVDGQQERVKKMKELEVFQKKLPWLKFEAAREAALAAKEELKVLEEKARTASTTLEPLKVMTRQYNSKFEKVEKDLKKAQTDFKTWAVKVEERAGEVTSKFEDIDKEKDELEAIDKAKAEAQSKVVKQQKIVVGLEKDMQNCKGEQYYEEQMALIKPEQDTIGQKKREIDLVVARASAQLATKQKDLNTLTRQEEAAKASNTIGKDKEKELEEERIDLIKTGKTADNRDIIPPGEREKILRTRSEAQTPGKFKDRLLGPLLCELRAKDPLVNKCMEYSLRPSTWKFFVATNVVDHDQLLKGKVTSMLVANQSEPNRPFSSEVLKELGIRGYLDAELLQTCDPLAVEAAKRLNAIHMVLVGTAQTDQAYNQNASRFRQLLSPPANCFEKIVLVTPTKRIEVTRSRYGNKEETMKVAGLDPRRALNLPLDNKAELIAEQKRKAEQLASQRVEIVKKKQQLEAEVVRLNEETDAAKAAKEEISNKFNELRDRKQQLMKDQAQERTLQSKLQGALEKLATFEKAANRDWERKAQESRSRLEELKAELADIAKEHVSFVAKCQSFSSRVAALTLNKAQIDAERQVLFELLKREEALVSNAASVLQQQRDKVKKLREQAVKLKEEADRVCDLTDDVVAEFQNVPDTVEEVEKLIIGHTATLAYIQEDATALATYERRLIRQKQLEGELDELAPTVESMKKELVERVTEWLGRVSDMAMLINTKIKYFFGKIKEAGYACAGEVELRAIEPKKAEESTLVRTQSIAELAESLKSDLTKCGMVIRVKFREEQAMSQLSEKVQSGGERSLTTFLYMLALQELSTVPFRVVDEINQGMDPDKERLAFYRLAEVSSKATSQYFMATPKLLPGLDFPKEATILFVFNGPFNLTQKDWDLRKFIQAQRTKRLSLSASSTATTTAKRQRVAEVSS